MTFIPFAQLGDRDRTIWTLRDRQELKKFEEALVGVTSVTLLDPETRTLVLRYGPIGQARLYCIDAAGCFIPLADPVPCES